jgi:hypothetical protein
MTSDAGNDGEASIQLVFNLGTALTKLLMYKTVLPQLLISYRLW